MNLKTEIFDVLWENRGRSFGQSGDVYQEFLYSAMQEGDAPGLIHVPIPPLRKKQLRDWTQLDYWVQDIHYNLQLTDLLLSSSVSSPDAIDFDGSTPTEVLGGASQIHQIAVNMVKRAGDLLDDRDLWTVEVNCGDRKLYLIYSDHDAWVLGYGCTVEIVESLDALSEKYGYFRVIDSLQGE